MASSKETFLRNEDDVKAALAITKSSSFDKLLVFSRAEFMQRYYPTSEQVKAVNDFIAILLGMADDEETEISVDSGIRHDLTPTDRTAKPSTPKK